MAKKIPVRYTPEIAAEICQRLALGESLRSICRSAGMPEPSAVRQWVIDDAHGFAAHYARARDIGLDEMADELLEVSRNPLEGTIEKHNSLTGTTIERRDAVDRARLDVDTRKWYLSKLAPKRYGDRLALEHSGTVSIAERLRAGRARVNNG